METMQAAPNEALLKTIEELRTLEQKNLRINRIKLICALTAVVLCILIAIILSVNVGRITRNINDLTAAVEETGTNINLVAEDLQKIDFELLGNSVQAFADSGTETIQQIKDATAGLDTILGEAQTALKNISGINIKQLNESIQELHDVLQPLANFFQIFQSN